MARAAVQFGIQEVHHNHPYGVLPEHHISCFSSYVIVFHKKVLYEIHNAIEKHKI